jgi:hypothetical protein
MKSRIIILLLFSMHATAQNAKFPKLKLSTPCTAEFSDNYKGKWLIQKNEIYCTNKEYYVEALKRVVQLIDLVHKFYPEPTGADVWWNGSLIKTSFADQVKYEWNENQMFNEEPVKINTVYRYEFNMILSPWYCCGGNQICNVFPDISGSTGLNVAANYLLIANANFMKGNEWTIDGRPIKTKMPSIGKWKDYDVLVTEWGPGFENFSTGSRYILLSRQGILPYLPVTRKQFFDRAIPYVTKWFDDMMSALNNPDKVEEASSRKFYMEQKNLALKRLQDELEQTRKHNLLDSPAIVSIYDMTMTTGPVFSKEVEGGRMLVTENPDYFRKDLPKYSPQFFILTWSGKDRMKAGDNWSYNFRKLVEENFPIEKLKAMIDK